jgi:hypothetical protein
MENPKGVEYREYVAPLRNFLICFVRKVIDTEQTIFRLVLHSILRNPTIVMFCENITPLTCQVLIYF